MSVVKARKLFLQRYANPAKFQKTNQSYIELYADARILYYILVMTIYPRGCLAETTNGGVLQTLHYIMKGYSLNFVELIIEYMTKV